MRKKQYEHRKLEGKRQKQITKTEEKVRLKQRLKVQCHWQGRQNTFSTGKGKVKRSPWIWTDSLK